VLRSAVPGKIVNVYADEGQAVTAGAPLVQLLNLPLQSEVSKNRADLALATGRANAAEITYGDYGSADVERIRFAAQSRDLESKASNLTVLSPISGIILTPRVRDLAGGYATAGMELMEVADLSELRVRIYVSEHEIYKFRVGSPGRIEVDSLARKRDARVEAIAPLSTQIPEGLEETGQYKGIRPPNFYPVDLAIPNGDGVMKPGMVGTARIYGRRCSLAVLAGQEIANFFGRKIW
jgi:multidrug resistance efflux pump